MSSNKKIAVAGATGRVGRQLVDVLTRQGHEVVAMSRSTGVDVITKKGLAEALADVECVVDVASHESPDEQAATDFFTTASRNLHEVGRRAGVERMVVVSIIGCERFTAGYNAAKAKHEQAVRSGPIPVQILRAGQFHEFVEQLMGWCTQGDTAYIPEMRTQLVAARTVAEAAADLATQGDASDGSTIPEIAGPRDENLVEVATLLARHRGAPGTVIGVSDPDDPDRELYQTGGLLPSAHAKLAGPTFEQWLESTSNRNASAEPNTSA